MKRYIPFILLSLPLFFSTKIFAQDVNALVQKVKAKINQVNDYEATGKMKTNVSFLKIPVASVKVLYKKPNKLKIKNEKGLSFIPKGTMNINLAGILNAGKYTILDAGMDKIGEIAVKVVKLLPEDDNGDLVLSTLYIDETSLLIRKAKTSTRENGSFELEMSYGKYAGFGLPDKIVFTFNTKEYKLPKGVTFDFDDGANEKKPGDTIRDRKGKAEISFSSYNINIGIADAAFQ